MKETYYALVAQLDRALVYGTKGWGFELLQAHQRSRTRVRLFVWRRENPATFSRSVPRECEFEPCVESRGIEGANVKDTSKIEKVGKHKTMKNNQAEPEKKFLNRIEFMDYIPTHEVVTYRHLFAYGFYIV